MRAQARSVIVSGLLLCLALLPAPASAQWVTLTFDDAGFTALFPGQPQYSSNSMTDGSAPYEVHNYIARSESGELLFMVGYTEYPADYVFDTAVELKADQDNFNRGIDAQLLTSRETTYVRASGDVLPALEFVSESPSINLVFKGIVILDGPKAYMAVAGNVRGIDAAADTDRMISSFRLLPH